MAVLDAERGEVVVRIVYDGPPFAGKTTSLRSLGRSLRRSVVTPLEAAGRTVYFDWMEYTGGLFEGHPIRCQLVSVPGQANRVRRRRALLSDADAVVFVVDTSTPAALHEGSTYLEQSTRCLADVGPPAAGVVVQANKRDVAGAVPLGEVRARLASAGVAILASAAHADQGVRETFVFAVRLALDRVRELVRLGRLPRGRPAVDDAEGLLRSFETEGEPPAVESPGSGVTARPTPTTVPRPPDASVPSGAIWPPVGGRVTLHEATAEPLRVFRAGDGDWVAGIGSEHRLHSARDAAFRSFDEGRAAILAWAREHARRAPLLSPARCIVLAEAGDGGARLWQILRTERSLTEALAEAAASLETDALLAETVEAARHLGALAAHDDSVGLPLSFDTVGRGEARGRFVGLVPLVPPDARPDPASLVARELDRALAGALGDRVEALAFAVRSRGDPDGAVAAALARLRPDERR